MQTLLSIIILIAAIPIGIFFKHLTEDEKTIYKKYFTPLLWVLAILAAIFYEINKQLAFTLTFMFIIVFVWNYK